MSEAQNNTIERRVVGKVVSDKMDKTVSVAIERLVRHGVYGKYIRRTTKLKAHDEQNDARMGDTVAISECRPVSKDKSWKVVEIVERATQR
ncbi:MAG: 30S ribosomal protein S17 [Pseudomonadota bacterium]